MKPQPSSLSTKRKVGMGLLGLDAAVLMFAGTGAVIASLKPPQSVCDFQPNRGNAVAAGVGTLLVLGFDVWLLVCYARRASVLPGTPLLLAGASVVALLICANALFAVSWCIPW